MLKNGKPVRDAKALMLGITFKENCPDIRNTRAIDIYKELLSYGMEVDVFDPWADPVEVMEEYGVSILSDYAPNDSYSAIILAVAHDDFKRIEIAEHKKNGAVIFDVKGLYDKTIVDSRL
jgi:UDP-N-acetyl-D-glucosamine/UDP-N-acetyl-D-galactosamine dehydrogenase